MRASSRGIFLAGCLFLVLHWASLGGYRAEETFTVLHYGRNLAEGSGLVFGNGERADAFVNLGWVLLLALPIRFGVDPLLAAKALGLLCSLGTYTILNDLLRRLQPSGRHWVPSLALAVGMAGSRLFGAAAASGLGTPLEAFMLAGLARTLAIEWEHRNFIGSAGWLALLTLTRPEAGALALVTALLVRIASTTRPAVAMMILGSLVAAVVLGLRWLYFGSLLPDSYAISIAPSKLTRITLGTEYVVSFFSALGPAAWILFAVGVLATLHRGIGPWLVPLVLGLSHMGLAVYLGGERDASGWRLLVPAMPCLLVPLVGGWGNALAALRRPLNVVVGVAAIVTFAHMAMVQEGRATAPGTDSQALQDIAPPDWGTAWTLPSEDTALLPAYQALLDEFRSKQPTRKSLIALNRPSEIAYLARWSLEGGRGYRFLDVYGRTDRSMAQRIMRRLPQEFLVDTVLARQPSMILASFEVQKGADAQGIQQAFTHSFQLLASPEFLLRYELTGTHDLGRQPWRPAGTREVVHVFRATRRPVKAAEAFLPTEFIFFGDTLDPAVIFGLSRRTEDDLTWFAGNWASVLLRHQGGRRRIAVAGADPPDLIMVDGEIRSTVRGAPRAVRIDLYWDQRHYRDSIGPASFLPLHGIRHIRQIPWPRPRKEKGD